MASIINALSSGTGGIVTSGDASGILQLQTANTAAVTIDGSQIATFAANVISNGVVQALTTVQSSSGADLSLNANGANRDVIVKVNGTEQARFVGSTSVLSITSGIKFPATQSASSDGNTLDDYEEGTWTPRNSSATALSINNSATYIKIGKLVFINADINQLSQDSVYGLPFTSASTGYPGVVTVAYNSFANQTLMGEFNGGTTNLTLRYNGSTQITPTNARIILAGCYVASA
jgi:hypothetical protein